MQARKKNPIISLLLCALCLFIGIAMLIDPIAWIPDADYQATGRRAWAKEGFHWIMTSIGPRPTGAALTAIGLVGAVITIRGMASKHETQIQKQ